MRINCEILDLRAFLAVLELASFGKAAASLNLSQPALSRRIQRLEETLGAALIERSTRRVAPTAIGRQMQPLVERLIDEFEGSIMRIGDLGGRQAGTVTIAAVPTAAFYFLPRVIKRFNADFPEIRFRIMDLSAGEAVDSVARGEVEFGINFLGASRPELIFTPLLADPFVLACRRDHPLAGSRQVTWRRMSGYPLVGVSQRSGNRDVIEQALARTGIRLNWFYEVNHLSTSLGLVEAGLGISVLPRLATPTGEHPVIAVKPLRDPEVSRTIGIVERRGGRLSPAAAKFKELLITAWSQSTAGTRKSPRN
jgi:DNA-binding transcriptional LysR family regulator